MVVAHGSPTVASTSPEHRKAVEEEWADEVAKATGGGSH